LTENEKNNLISAGAEVVLFR